MLFTHLSEIRFIPITCTIMFDFSLQVIPENSGNRYLIATRDEKLYAISEVLYHILLAKQSSNLNDEAIADQLNVRYETSRFTNLFIAEATETTLAKIRPQIPCRSQQPDAYILFRRTLIPAGSFKKGYHLLSFLFKKWLFVLLSGFSVLVTILFLRSISAGSFSVMLQSAISELSVANTGAAYCIFFLIIFIHETGHASAAYRFGVTPKEIGIGLYFIYPVFFTNVTDIWKLPAKQRMIVNLAGIYFQLLINLLLILIFYTTALKSLCFILLVINTISVLTSFNPFFRYDGYWMVSDWFNLPNLRERSLRLLTGFLFGGKIRQPFSWSLTVYAVLYAAFWIFVYYRLFVFCLNSGKKILFVPATRDARSALPELSSTIISSTCFLLSAFVLSVFIYKSFKILRHELSAIRCRQE